MLAFVFFAAAERASGTKMTGWAGKTLEPTLRAVRDGRQKAIRLPSDELLAAIHANHPVPRDIVALPSLAQIQAAARDLGHKALEPFFFAPDAIPGQSEEPAHSLLELSRHLDELWWRMLKAVEEKNLDRLRETMLGDNVLPSAYWQAPFGHGEGVRESIRAARSMPEAEASIQMLGWNCQLSVMALWDLAFRASRFADFQAAPLFLFLMPRKKPTKPTRVRGPRDEVDLPFGLLLELITVLYVRMHRNWDGERDEHRWLTRPPAPRDMARCFPASAEPGTPDGRGPEQYKAKIDRLMSGEHPLTMKALHENTKPPTPVEGKKAGSAVEEGLLPLLIAAQLWDMRLVQRDKRNKPCGVLQVDADYLRFWQMHRADLQARGFDIAGGDIPWPAYLQDRLAQLG